LSFQDFVKDLSVLHEDEICTTVEREAEEFETAMLAALYPELPVFDFEIN
jgi:hypothetical protein